MLYSISNQIDSPDLEAIKQLEGKLGKTLIAFYKLENDADKLDDAELAELKSLEQKLDVVLVAVKQ